jgi:formylglycine-generating enzyme required for sulfatase activity
MMGRSEYGADACPSGSTCEYDEQPIRTVYVDAFYLDTFEVTVGRFRKFVMAYDGTPPQAGSGDHHALGAGWQKEWNSQLPDDRSALMTSLHCHAGTSTWTDNVDQYENSPINCVDFYEAMAFCLWDGGRLPTEAEWEYVASGVGAERLYPWGQTDPAVDTSLANDGYSDASPLVDVGIHSKGKGSLGHFDLGGGVYEWTMDLYAGDWYSTQQGNECDNCANLAGAVVESQRSIRGGGWSDGNLALRAAFRYHGYATSRFDYAGVRCLRSK